MKHLNDQDIQNYLDKKLSDDAIGEHLQNCSYCQHQVTFYEQLFVGLKKQNDIALTANFAQKIIGTLESKQEKRVQWREWFFMGLLGLIGAGVTIYYSNIADVADKAKDFVEIDDSIKETAGDWISQLGGLLSGNFQFIVFGLFILLIIDWLDKKLIRKVT